MDNPWNPGGLYGSNWLPNTWAQGGPGRPKVISGPASQPLLSADQFRRLGAVVLSEGDLGQYPMITWVYINAIHAYGFEAAMRRSTPYRLSEASYRFWLTALGDNRYANDPPPGWVGIGHYPTNEEAVASRHPSVIQKVDGLLGMVVDQWEHPERNPIRAWLGQGSIDDLNKNNGKWKEARQYLYFQLQEGLHPVRVRILESGTFQTVIFDEYGIQAYFRENPHRLAPIPPAYPFVE